jgi:CDP-diacylglycerol--serine O-phosphatidyltransferase
MGFRLWRYLAQDKLDQSLPPGIFNGLPGPAGAMVALGVCLFWQNPWISWAGILFTAYLLVSHIRFVHFGRVILPRIPHPFIVIFGFIVVLIITYLIKAQDHELLGGVLLVSFLVYVLTGYKMITRDSI